MGSPLFLPVDIYQAKREPGGCMNGVAGVVASLLG
jgi:hypothetical protein